MKKLHVTAAVGAALVLALAVPATASAHVTVSPNTATPGSYALVNFKVPNESATAVTTKLEVTLPADTPFSSVSYVPVAGWTTQLIRQTLPAPVTVGKNTITEAVTTIIWTAAPGYEITDGQLQVFPVSLGPVPDVGALLFPAQQTYSDGTVVSWTETGSDAEHPAPVLYVGDAPAASHHDEPASASGADAVARGLGIGGLVLGAIGVIVAIGARRRQAVS